MPPRLSVRLAVVITCVLPAAIWAEKSAGKPPALPSELDAYVAKAMRDWDVPGLALAIVKDDQVVIAKGYGVREVGKPEPVDRETIFDVASLTKSFTAAGAAVLVDEGKLGWDDRVRERLPRVTFGDPYVDHEATLRDLLCHRTGLQPANGLFVFMRHDRDEILRRVRFLKPTAPFRIRMVYSNVLYTVAGELTAAAAGTSWAELIRRRVVEPAGMRSTSVEKRPTGSNVARPHAVLGGVQQAIPPFDFTMVGPASSIYSNALDMARWLRLQLNDGMLDGKQIISRAQMVEMHSPQAIISTTLEQRSARLVEHFPAYGLGWQVMDFRGEPLLWHSGNARGMPCYMALLLRKELGVVVMLNTSAAPTLHGALVSWILDAYLGSPPHDWSGEALSRHQDALRRDAEHRKTIADRRAHAFEPDRPLTAYVGTYESELWGDIDVHVERDVLGMRLAKGESGELSPWDRGAFLVTWTDPVTRETFYDTIVTFGSGEDGTVERFFMTVNRDRIEAKRRAE